MGRKRKLMTGIAPIGGPSLKSRREARRVTSAYHVIKNEMESIAQSATLTAAAKQSQKATLELRLEDIGGTNRYQEASIVSTKHFKTSRWVLATIHKYLQSPPPSEITSTTNAATSTNSSAAPIKVGSHARRLQVLEVGAINIQLQQASNLSVRAIDVHSQHPSIEEVDFFDVPPVYAYDCVVCSMVVNCVHTPTRRGEMLARLRGHLRDENSLLLLVLPARCIDSRHVGRAPFAALLHALGYSLACELKVTPHLMFYTLRRGSFLVVPAVERGSIGAEQKEEEKSKGKGKGKGKGDGDGDGEGEDEGQYTADIPHTHARTRTPEATTTTTTHWRLEAEHRLARAPRQLQENFSENLDHIASANEFAIGFAINKNDGGAPGGSSNVSKSK